MIRYFSCTLKVHARRNGRRNSCSDSLFVNYHFTCLSAHSSLAPCSAVLDKREGSVGYHGKEEGV